MLKDFLKNKKEKDKLSFDKNTFASGKYLIDPLEVSGARCDALDREKLPQHVAIIMDGNGRWAKGQGLLRQKGHLAGVKALKKVLKTAIYLDLEVLTVYAFSTENWKRPLLEVNFLMKLFLEKLADEIDELDADNVQIKFIGCIDELPRDLLEQINEAVERTKNNTGVIFNIALNYGGQDEILRAVQKIAQYVKEGQVRIEDINIELIEDSLDTAKLPPVDLVIRTSGDVRLSNFLLFQTAYAEFYFTEINWPDFRPDDFIDALEDYGKRERRFGKLST